ncbi:MAG: DUF2461 family protein [Thermoplasmata archaeon]
MVASGIWHPAPPELRKIRDPIVAASVAWGRVLARGIEIGGKSYVRVPPGHDPGHPFANDLRRKDFYAQRPLPDSVVLGPRFARTFLARCRELEPLNEFLARAVRVPW